MEDGWIQRLINPQALRGLYDEEPSLDGFVLHEMRLEQRGPSFFLRGDLRQFPDHPRPSWDGDADRLQIRFSLSAVDHFQAGGTATSGDVDMTIEKAPGGLGVVMSGRGDDLHFEVAGIGLQIIGMKPHQPQS